MALSADEANLAEVTIDDIRKPQMVGWYDPAQLLRTGLEVAISTVFGRHSDSRRLDAVSSVAPLLDYRGQQYLESDGSFGVDYIADTGDGWNSTYSIAFALSQPEWTAPNYASLKRGKLLILGGDLVYPYPTREYYNDRLLTPFALAGRLHGNDKVDVLALPGNHDWYDSLVNFRRLFCCGRMFGPYHTRQTRSYFAAALPAGWWILGVDVQLDGDLDESQSLFFNEIVDRLNERDRVILCVPEPVWHRRWDQGRRRIIAAESLLATLERRLGHKLRLWVAGDLHHYQRHSSADGRHLITCGMGGAFLHPTHEMPTDPTGEFVHERSFPKEGVSKKLTLWNLRFLTRNPLFGMVPGSVYLLAAWQNGLAVGECFHHVCIDEMGYLGLSQWKEAVVAGFHSALLSPIGIALYAVIFWGFVFFADRRSNRFRYSIGILHALSHVSAGFLIYWFGVYAAISLAGLTPKSIGQYVVTGSLIFLLSWIIGSVVLGCYLLVSLNAFGMHHNEAFSALRIQDWKGFLRFHIDKEGTLRMRFVGFETVPRRWQGTRLSNGVTIASPATGVSLVGSVYDELDIAAQ